MPQNPLLQLRSLGQRIWLDPGWSPSITDGTLRRLIEADGLAGLNAGPALPARAFPAEPGQAGAAAGQAGPAEIHEQLAVAGIRAAAELFRPAFESSGGSDGLVNLGVSPRLAGDADATVNEALRLWRLVDRPNVLIKVPATAAGLPAIERLVAAGVNVNVTLLFGLRRQRQVLARILAGLQQRCRAGRPVAGGLSVTSLHPGRIDSRVDALLDRLLETGNTTGGLARRLCGHAAIAIARLAYRDWRAQLSDPRWTEVTGRGALAPRLHWDTTFSGDPARFQVRYVEALIGPDTLCTLPLPTLEAFRDHGRAAARLAEGLDAAEEVVDALGVLGIDLDEVALELEQEGLARSAADYEHALGSLAPERLVAYG